MRLRQISRRNFLALASLGVGTCLARTSVAAEVAKIGFGYSLYGMKSIKVLDAIRICADIGYSGVELACLKDWPCDPFLLNRADRDSIRSVLDDQALDLPALMDNLVLLAPDSQHRDNLDRMKRVFELGRELSPEAPPIFESVLGGKPDEWMTVRERMVERLRDWEKVASAHEMIVAIKAHAFGALHTPKDAKWLVQQINSRWIRLAFDYSHFQRQQLALKESLAEVLTETVFVHVKDNRKIGDQTEFALPGEAGDIDYADYLRQLRDGGYRGSVVVEVSGQISSKPGYDPIAAAKRSYSNLQPAFVKAGLRIET